MEYGLQVFPEFFHELAAHRGHENTCSARPQDIVDTLDQLGVDLEESEPAVIAIPGRLPVGPKGVVACYHMA
jgi:hypothetical protein